MKKKGFTLIELLAVIVILAIIALIATPAVLNIIEDSRESSVRESTNGIIRAAKNYYASQKLSNNDVTSIDLTDGTLNYNGALPEEGNITFDEKGNIDLTMYMNGYCVTANSSGITTFKGDITDCNVDVILDTCYDAKVITKYDIDTPRCAAFIKDMEIYWWEDEEEYTKYCTKGAMTTDYYSLESDIEYGNVPLEYLLELEIVKNPVYEDKCLSCFEYDKIVRDFSIDTDACVEFTKKYNFGFENEEDYVNYCTKGKFPAGETYNLETDIKTSQISAPWLIQENVIYDVTYYNDVEITNYRCTENNQYNLPVITNVVIPDRLDGKKVKRIGGYSFQEKNIESVTFSSGITEILSSAFSYNQISSIDLPTSIEYLGDGAFEGNLISGELDLSHLTNLKYINAFDDNQITNIKLPKSIETLEYCAFSGNNLSGELDLSDLPNLKYVSGFEGNGITSVKLPTSITSIGNQAFHENNFSGYLDLSYLTNLEFVSGFRDNAITGFKFPNTIEYIDYSTFISNDISGYLDLSYLTNLKYISGFADNRISGLKLPTSVETIGWAAFSKNDLSGELDLSYLPNLKSIEYEAFKENSFTGTLDLSMFTDMKEINGFSRNGFTKIILPKNITAIGEAAFYGNDLSGELDLREYTKLTRLSDSSFGYNDIESIKLPNTITYIGSSTFSSNKISGELDLSHLTNLEVISGFSNNEIETIKLPSNTTEISWNAFSSNNFSGTLDLSEYKNLTALRSSSFSFSEINNVVLPENLEILESDVFSYNRISGLLDLSSNLKLKEIGSEAFEFNEITEVKLPNSIELIEEYAFSSSDETANVVGNGVPYNNNPNLSSIIIDKKSGTLSGAPWGAVNATITYLR